MKNTPVIVGALVVLVLVGGAYVMRHQIKAMLMPGTTQSAVVPATSPEPTAVMGGTGASSEVGSSSEASATKTFTVTGANFSFDVKEIKVKKGDTVKIVFKNTEGHHDWVLDEFNAKTKVIAAGAEDEVTFTVDKAGTFEYYCGVGNHRAMGMVGKFIVE